MDRLLEIARRPAATTSPNATVRQLSEQMVANRTGAIAVTEDGLLVGIVSERDIVRRVVALRRDVDKTTVREIMTSHVHTARAGMGVRDAIQVMLDNRIRHLPFVNEAGAVIGMMSVRHLLKLRVAELDLKNVDLFNFIAADGPGG